MKTFESHFLMARLTLYTIYLWYYFCISTVRVVDKLIEENIMSNKLLRAAMVHSGLALLLVGTVTGCSETTPPPPAEANVKYAYEEGVAGGVFVGTVEMKVKVVAVDTSNRKLTLMDSNGDELTMKIGPEVINFDQIRANDMINVIVTNELIISVYAEGTVVEEGAAGLVALAPKGAKPGGLMAGTIVVTAKVVAIDETNRTATLEFKDGSSKIFAVRKDLNLSQHKIGEQVVFRITEMIAISVEKAKEPTK